MPQNKDTRHLNQSLYPNCKSKEANVKKEKKIFNGQIVKIQGRRRQRGKVDWGPGWRALACSSSRGIRLLSFITMADPSSCSQLPLGSRRPWISFSQGWGMEAWSHAEVTQPENLGFYIAKDLSR